MVEENLCFAPAVSRQQLMGNDQFRKGDCPLCLRFFVAHFKGSEKSAETKNMAKGNRGKSEATRANKVN
jgi:hypothetical protein